MFNFILENGFFIYQYKLFLNLFFMYLIYFLFLKNETNFKLNRFYLIFSVLFSLVIPFLNFETFIENENIFNFNLNEIDISKKNFTQNEAFFNEFDIIFLIYFLISFIFFFFLMKEIFFIKKIIYKNKVIKLKNINFVLLDKKSSSFSFFNYLFISKDIFSDIKKSKIILHEKVHIKQFHSLDLLFLEILKIIFWFNPLIYLYKKSISEVHEYLADDGVLKKTKNSVSYKRLILEEVFYSNYNIANYFNQLTIKNRLVMMTKIKSSEKSKFKILFALPVLIVLFIFSACSDEEEVINNETKKAKTSKIISEGDNKNNIKEEVVLNTAEVMPKFIGDNNAFNVFLSKNIKFPEKEKAEGLQQKVFVSFVIDKDGSIIDVEIVATLAFNEKENKFKGRVEVSPGFKKEAIRVIKFSKWKAGEKNGEKVKIKMSIPIIFRLS